MRKNSVRKFIHAILDLLPLFAIPIFAIYSMNHEISGNSINTSGYEVRNKFETNEINTTDDLIEGNIYKYVLPYTSFVNNIENILETSFLQMNNNIVLETSTDFGSSAIIRIESYSNNSKMRLAIPYNNNTYYIPFDINEDLILYFTYKTLSTFSLNNAIISESDLEVLEYVWNDGIVLDDEDIMSQFVYVTYNAVDKYFNMGNVFNMNGVYDWFVVNIFGGNAPISLFIVWNVVLYEFVMDLLMLLYGLFMWFIDMIEKLMNKPLDSIK